MIDRRKLLTIAGECTAGLLAGIAALVFCNQAVWMHPKSLLWANRIDAYEGQDLGGTLFMLARSLAGDSGLRTELIGWPVGHVFNNHFLNPLFTDLMAPFVSLFDQPLGYNIALLLALATNGLAVQAAVRMAGAGRTTGILVCALAAASPFAMNEALEGRGVSAWWAPAILATVFCLSSMKSWKQAWLMVPGLWMLWISLVVYPYAPALIAPWTLLAGFVVLVHPGDDRKGRLVRAGILLVCAVGVLAVYLAKANIDPSSSLDFSPPGGASTHLGHVVPRELFYLGIADTPQWWFNILKKLGWANLAIEETSLLRVPASLVLATIIACVVGKRTAWVWAPALAVSVALFVISIGPSAGSESSLYTWLMENVRYYRACPRPDRYAIPAWFLGTIALGTAYSAALKGRSVRTRQGLSAALAYIVLMQVWTAQPSPLQTWPPFVGLDGLDEEKILLDLPIGLPDKTIMLLYATHPVKRATPPPQGFQVWRDGLSQRNLPLLQAVAEVEAEGALSEPMKDRLVIGSLPEVSAGLRCIALHPEEAHNQELEPWMTLLSAAGASLRAITPSGVRIYSLVEDEKACVPTPSELNSKIDPAFPQPLNSPGEPGR